ncbi:MAG: sigma-70 family RNA polymerase sigma factor [Anaerolineales bacterium]|nr:sigma-70 family RNA polymerase sigma factor [Anaerolineales bacterium]
MKPYLSSQFSVLSMETHVLSEVELIDLAHRLDSRVLAQIYDQYNNDLYRYAMRILGNPSMAEDCVAETFHRFLQALAAGRGPREHIRAYLYRIAHNWITDQFRREAPEDELPDQLAESALCPEEHAERSFQCASLRYALRQLTPEQRQVITLKFWEGWENEEIARALGKPVGAIKSLQHRAIAALQRQMEEKIV